MKFFIKDFFSKGANPQFPTDLVKFTEKIINGKLRFLGNMRYCHFSSRGVFRALKTSKTKLFVKITSKNSEISITIENDKIYYSSVKRPISAKIYLFKVATQTIERDVNYVQS